jgi:tRNA(Arg) A34 adenosine deaminase TadA
VPATDVERQFMEAAIAKAVEGIAAGQSPFGSVLVKHGVIVVATHNTVWRDVDPTAHAEVNCLRASARLIGSIGLEGCTLFSTCEPCPMCLAAIHWAKVDRVVFGAAIEDATAAGFSELPVPAATLAALGRSPVRVESGLLRDECAALFARWREAGLSSSY